VANYPVSVITDGMGLNITVMSYLGKLDFGIVADRVQMPDLDRFLGWLGDGVRELLPADSGPATDTPAAPAPQRVDGTAATSTTQSVTDPADR
jgi:hypothetical protein